MSLAVSAAPADKICADISRSQYSAPFSLASLKTRFLRAHNGIRHKYGVPEVKWDNGLARYAQEWANYLKKNKQCNIQHRTGAMMKKRYGENLGFNWTSKRLAHGHFDGSPEKVTMSWAKECKDFSLDRGSCKSNAVCGHFTQVVWKDTKKIGCGVAVCEGQGHAEVWVCNYDPPGNVIKTDGTGKRLPLKPF
ncbi:MAG TPA: CAP domain-containing protein [Myxococcota bacterium]|nr:CAP domain-containing protein [Myxococcota bacterium]